MNRVFKTRNFSRWVRKAGLTEQALCEAVAEVERGLIDADPGGGILKQRVALPGRGKSGGARVLIATNRRDRWFFLYGFSKNERASVTTEERAALRDIAVDLLALASQQLDAHVRSGALQEICHEQEEQAAQSSP